MFSDFFDNKWGGLDPPVPDKCFGKGGGGSSGAVTFPAYLEAAHTAGLAAVKDLVDGTGSVPSPYDPNPYIDSGVNDPTDAIDAMYADLAIINNKLDNYDAGTDYAALYATYRATVYDDTVGDDSLVPALQAAAVQLLTDTGTNALAGFKAKARSIGATTSSAFSIGEALIYGDVQKQAYQKYTAIKADFNKTWLSSSSQAVASLMANELQNSQMRTQLQNLIQDAASRSMGMRWELSARYLEIAGMDATWDFEKWQRHSNYVAGVQGESVTPTQPRASMAQTAISGGLSGAATGAAIGSAVPGVGTAIGAGVGGVLGLAASFM